jgi:hypothetical protein
MKKYTGSESRTTPEVVVTFPKVLKPESYQGGKAARSVRILFDKNNTGHMAFLKLFAADMNKVMADEWPDANDRPRIPVTGHDKSPIKDGDKNCNQQGIPFKEKYPELAGHYFLNASKYVNDKNPTAYIPVVDKNKADILDASEIYSGCICCVNINAYARTRQDNPGISVGLNGIQKRKDGERIGGSGGPSVDDMFESTGAADPLNYQSDDLPF